MIRSFLLPLLLCLLEKLRSLFPDGCLNLGWCIKLTIWLTTPTKHCFVPVGASIMHGNLLEYIGLAHGPYTHADSVTNGIIVKIGGRVT